MIVIALFFYLFSCSLLCYIIIKTWKFRKKSPGKELVIAMICVTQWVFCSGTELFIKSYFTKVLLSTLCYVGCVFYPAFILKFSFHYAGILSVWSKRSTVIFFSIPLLITLGAITNSWHHQLWPSIVTISPGVLRYDKGTLFYINAVYCFMSITAANALFFMHVLKEQKTRKSGIIMLTGFQLSWWTGILYVTGWNPFPGYDIVAMGTCFAAASIIIANHYNDLFSTNVLPLADKSVKDQNAAQVDAAESELAHKIMHLTLRTWEKKTGTSKIEFAQESKLWSVQTDSNGWSRTQTLDKYLDLQKVPDRPRWNIVKRSAEFVLSLPSNNDTSELTDQLHLLLRNLNKTKSRSS
jgi:N-terminal 7TM region of histidine kinase